VSSKGGEDGAVSQDIEFVFKEVAAAYKRQDNNGMLKEAKFFRWNIAEMSDTVDGSLLTLK
jgi:type VI secretion system secreted protein Hcp